MSDVKAFFRGIHKSYSKVTPQHLLILVYCLWSWFKEQSNLENALVKSRKRNTKPYSRHTIVYVRWGGTENWVFIPNLTYFYLFVLPDIYRKHRPKYNCNEPTFNTSHRPVYPPVPVDMGGLLVCANGSPGMPCWVVTVMQIKITCNLTYNLYNHLYMTVA